MLDILTDVVARLRRGTVVGPTLGGRVRVRDERGEREFVCELLRITAAPPPELPEGATVAFVADDGDEDCNYVLGVIECLGPRADERADSRLTDESQTIRVRAAQRLELSCGRASLIMNADGTVVLKGTTVVSRASGVNKIRGAAVRIN